MTRGVDIGTAVERGSAHRSRWERSEEHERPRAYAWALAVLVIGAFPAVASAGVAPGPVGQIDCNGLSPIQASIHPTAACADLRGIGSERGEDNDHYIGHDEPAVRFVSNAPGSGNDVTFVERLGTDPSRLPTVRHPGSDVTHWFELSVAPWFSLDVCDPNSTPVRPCKPNSDANAPDRKDAGAAFVELQFYPPGFAPFSDSISCDNTHYCSALTSTASSAARTAPRATPTARSR